MEKFSAILVFLCMSSLVIICAGDEAHKKLFLFGDSFVDTANTVASPEFDNPCEYGITFPGYAFGRQSNGRILTDYLATFLNTSCPPSYTLIKKGSVANSTELLKYGINFAVAGSGVFKTWQNTTLAIQIQHFKDCIGNKIFDRNDIENSIVIIIDSGNDIGYFMAQHNKQLDFSNITNQLVDQLALNLKEILHLGARKIVVSGLRPLECEPANVGDAYGSCVNSMTKYILDYNNLLQQALRSLKDDNKNSTIIYMDIYTAFLATISQRQKSGSKSYPNPLEPCCKRLYSENKTILCKDPELAFYIDDYHPTQSGWHDIFKILESSL